MARSPAMAPKIFISYRRQDSRAYAGRLYDGLCNKWGQENLFMDIDNLKAGVVFAKILSEVINSSAVILVVIGKNWVAESNGVRRIDDEEDFVRWEVAMALKRDILIIPILVDDAHMPRRSSLPADIRDIASLHAHKLSDERWRSDVARLNALIEEELSKSKAKIFGKSLAREEDGEAAWLAQEAREEEAQRALKVREAEEAEQRARKAKEEAQRALKVREAMEAAQRTRKAEEEAQRALEAREAMEAAQKARKMKEEEEARRALTAKAAVEAERRARRNPTVLPALPEVAREDDHSETGFFMFPKRNEESLNKHREGTAPPGSLSIRAQPVDSAANPPVGSPPTGHEINAGSEAQETPAEKKEEPVSNWYGVLGCTFLVVFVLTGYAAVASYLRDGSSVTYRVCITGAFGVLMAFVIVGIREAGNDRAMPR